MAVGGQLHVPAVLPLGKNMANFRKHSSHGSMAFTVISVFSRWRWVVSFTSQPSYPWARTAARIVCTDVWAPELGPDIFFKWEISCDLPKVESRIVQFVAYTRGVDNSLAQPDWKNNWKVAIFRPTRRSLLPRRPGWTDNLLNFFLSGLQKLQFGRCSLFPSWSG